MVKLITMLILAPPMSIPASHSNSPSIIWTDHLVISSNNQELIELMLVEVCVRMSSDSQTNAPFATTPLVITRSFLTRLT